MSEFGKVAVLMGGQSAEREISLLSGAVVLNALQAQGVDAHMVDAGPDVIGDFRDGNFDRSFIILHGRGGEDGVIQGVLETLSIPYTGSGVLGSALGINKLHCKLLWQGYGLSTPPFVVLNESSDLDRVAAEIGFPVMVKPAREGSSFGLTCVDAETDLEAAWRHAAHYDSCVLAEKWITGKEYTVGIIGDEVLPVIQLETPHRFYDYEAKYESDTTQYHCPCGLSHDAETALQTLAQRAFDVIDASGWGRVDMIVDEQGVAWLIEVNTVPGMTDHSLVPMAARVGGYSLDELVMKIMATAQ